MDEIDKRLVVYESRIEALELTIESLADSMLKMEKILDELSDVFLTKEDKEEK